VLVTVVDYGAGNLHSLCKALGDDVRVVSDPVRALDTELLVLPGVGNFAHAAEQLAPGRDLMRLAIEGGLPCVGICLGMQLLFEGSEEGPGVGLGVFEGRARRLRSRRVPHMGWNAGFYYAHSYVCPPVSAVMMARHEEDEFPAMVRRGKVVGVQFHPEKSGAEGVRFLRGLIA
jgi:glutamine amidotransferase